MKTCPSYVSFLKIGFSLCFFLILTGCSQIPLRSAWNLHNVDYFTIDPTPFRLALALPKGTILKEVTMSWRLMSDEQAHPSDIISFDIVTSGPEFELIELPDQTTSNIILRVPPSRIDDLIRVQQSTRKARETGQRGAFSISTSADPGWLEEYCSKNGGDFTIKAWIKINDLDGYFPLIRESKLMALLKQSGGNICDGIKDNVDQV